MSRLDSLDRGSIMRDGIRTGCGLLEVGVPQIVMFGMCFDFYNTPPQVIYNQAEHQNRSLSLDVEARFFGSRLDYAGSVPVADF
jgi:hypothetical protein